MDNTNDPIVTDADVVSEPDTNAASTEDGAQILLDLESTIKSHIAMIDKGKADLKNQREMLESALMNDETYRTHAEEAKKAAKVKAKTKFEILQQPANKQLAEKIKELTAQSKELNAALSDYLREYQRMSGSSEIETDDGEVREIIYVAKLVKKSSRS